MSNISGIFPIRIEGGTPVLRSRGEWNASTEYVYDYNFRDMVVINPGLDNEMFFIVKNRYNKVFGQDTMPPNDLYWQESDKIQFLWAGAIKTDMIDTDNLVVKNLVTDTNKSESRIEISKESNDIRVYDKEKLRVLISPRNPINMEDVVDVNKTKEIVSSSTITYNANYIWSGTDFGINFNFDSTIGFLGFNAGERYIYKMGTINISGTKLTGISLSNISIKADTNLIEYNNKLEQICNHLGLNVNITNTFLAYVPFGNPDKYIMKIYINRSENGVTINNGIHLCDIDLVRVNDINNMYYSQLFNATKALNLTKGEYNIIYELVQDRPQDTGIMWYKIKSIITKSDDVQLTDSEWDSLINYLNTQLIDFLNILKLSIPQFNMIMNFETVGELIGINNNSFYIFSGNDYYHKLFSKDGILTGSTSMLNNNERYIQNANFLNISKKHNELSCSIDNNKEIKFSNKGFSYSDCGYLFLTETPQVFNLSEAKWEESVFIGHTGKTMGRAPHVYFNADESYYKKISPGKIITICGIRGQMVAVGKFILENQSFHDGLRVICEGGTHMYIYCGYITFGGNTGHIWKEVIVSIGEVLSVKNSIEKPYISPI